MAAAAARAAAVRDAVRSLVGVRAAFPDRLRGLDDALEALARDESAAAEAGAAVARAVAGDHPPAPPARAAALRRRRDEARAAAERRALGRGGRRPAGDAGRDRHRGAVARAHRDERREVLERRAELRGRFDALTAKAIARGRAEDLALDALRAEAHDRLWSAPCDLAAATVALRRYQRALEQPRGGTVTACVRSGCDGAIADDGYCDTCGRAAAAAPPAPVTPPGPATARDPRRPGEPRAPRPPPPPRRRGGWRAAASPSGRTRSTSSRRHIGGGLVEIAAQPRRDPADAVLTDPQVPERSRFCGRCEAAVGRADPSRDRPGRTAGFCPQCGTAYSFVPDLAAGEVIAGQYEVVGCLAHGGLGWIHLAVDHAVDDRWVVLKGLIDTGDEAALAAAIAERGFLARLEHPRIVRIYNVVEHRGAVYLVMEYIDGRSLRQMRDPRTPMSPAEALAFVLEALPALAHVHELGLLYCDFKPDNVIQSGTELRLIDLGAVRRMDDPGGDVWGTVGYQAPEIRADGRGPTVASDVYTVGRTLAVLTMNFDFSRALAHRLPDAIDAPVLAEHDGFRRLLERATDPEPGQRFASIGELAEQATGVLRQVVAADAEVPPPPRLSTVFGPLRGVPAVDLEGPPKLADLPVALPILRTDPDDPAAAALSSSDARATLAALAELARLDGRAVDSEQARRRRTVLARAELGDRPGAEALLAGARTGDDARWAWVDARRRGRRGRPGTAAPQRRGRRRRAARRARRLVPAGRRPRARRRPRRCWPGPRAGVADRPGLDPGRLRAGARAGWPPATWTARSPCSTRSRRPRPTTGTPRSPPSGSSPGPAASGHPTHDQLLDAGRALRGRSSSTSSPAPRSRPRSSRPAWAGCTRGPRVPTPTPARSCSTGPCTRAGSGSGSRPATARGPATRGRSANGSRSSTAPTMPVRGRGCRECPCPSTPRP